MLSKRIMAIILTAAASALVLFGGWFVYERSVVAAPIQKAITASEGIISAGAPDMTSDKVTIEVTLEADARLRSVYESVKKQVQPMLNGRELVLDIKQQPSERLDEAWSAALFDIAEAMETKHYSQIPESLQAISDRYDGIQAVSEMDDTNVYITLRDGESTKFVVLPRTPSKLEVWTNA
ncbi:hypothetical protein ACFSL6_16365 [Paenibacillus thailandensis]|uniref:hypothetical protein n=1 Tax=Paenibacillus thailandensis TaxID=393250 RepID=UPI00362B0910